MGVIAREIQTLKGKKQVARRRQAEDSMREAELNAELYRENENNTATYLKQLYYGIDQLLKYIVDQDVRIKTLDEKMSTMMKSTETLVTTVQEQEQVHLVEEPVLVQQTLDDVTASFVAIKTRKPARESKILSLARAFNMIEKYRSERGRILWSQAPNPKKLVFAYLRKAELEKLDITSTMVMQSIPEYRRVFQYVVYHIGSWKEIVAEYTEQQRNEERERVAQ